MNTRLRSIIRKEFIQIFRDKRTLAIILLIPIMQLFLLGYAATNDIRNIPLAVYDQCRCAESVPCSMPTTPPITSNSSVYAHSEDEIRELIQAGSCQRRHHHPAGLQHPPGARRCPGGVHPGWLQPHLGIHRLFSRHPHRAVACHHPDGRKTVARRRQR